MPEIPPWIQAADPASHMARGLSIGVQLGAQQAEERYRAAQMAQRQQEQAAQMSAQQAAQAFEQQFKQQQAARAEQQDAVAHAEFQQRQDLNASQVAKKYEAIQNYQNAIARGMDVNEAMLTYGPAMGQGTAEAAAIRAKMMQSKLPPPPVPMPEVKFADVGGKQIPYLVDKKTGRGTWAPSGALADRLPKGQLSETSRLMMQQRLDKTLDKLVEDNPTFDISAKAPNANWNERTKANFMRVKARAEQLKQQRDALDLPAGGAAAAAGTPAAGGKVKVKNPQGVLGLIPEDQLDEALQEGYTEVD